MGTILLIGVILECAILLALAVTKKCTRKAFWIISAVTILCCAVVTVANPSGKSTREQEGKTKGFAYMSAQLLSQNRPEDALSALGQITEAEGEEYGVKALRSLAYNKTGAYAAGMYLVKGETDANLAALYHYCSESTAANDALTQYIVADVLEKLALSSEEMAHYDAEMAVRYGSSVILQIKAAIDQGNRETAYQLAADYAAKGTMADQILVSEMYLLNYNERFLAEEDEAFDALLQEVTALQIDLTKMAATGETDTKAYDECMSQYQVALMDLDNERAKRAVNYLNYGYEEGASDDLAYHLQMARLLYAAGEREEATGHLEQLFQTGNQGSGKWLSLELELMCNAFLDGMGNIEIPEFDALYTQLMDSLYQGVLSGNSAGSSFYEFLRSYLQEHYSGIYIGPPDVSAFPKVQLPVSTSVDFVLSRESLKITDTETAITDFTVEENASARLSICFVIDRSGSMAGTYLTSAKQAVKNFASLMDDDTEAALVSFESTARTECPLVDSPHVIMAQMEKMYTTGGTNIPSGLVCAAEELFSATGKKVIILLSDGYDGNKSELPSALRQLKNEGITVYAIGLPGCEESYLSSIAEETNGTYFPASKASDLTSIYNEISSLLKNTYTITYTVADEASDRSVWIEAVDSTAQTRRKYTTDITTSQYSVNEDGQKSNMFKQTGGTVGGY